jgi:hypothetical protein
MGLARLVPPIRRSAEPPQSHSLLTSPPAWDVGRHVPRRIFFVAEFDCEIAGFASAFRKMF